MAKLLENLIYIPAGIIILIFFYSAVRVIAKAIFKSYFETKEEHNIERKENTYGKRPRKDEEGVA